MSKSAVNTKQKNSRNYPTENKITRQKDFVQNLEIIMRLEYSHRGG